MSATTLVAPVATTRSRRRRRTYVAPRRNNVLAAIYRAEGPITAADAGCTPAYMLTLESPEVGAPLVKRAGTVKSSKPGRPAVLWTLTDAGRKRIGLALGDYDRKGRKVR